MSRIVRVEIGRFDYRFAGEFKFFQPGPDGSIRRPTLLVRITDDSGACGWGQTGPVPTWSDETVEGAAITLQRYFGPALLGADPHDLPDIHARMNNALRPTWSVSQPIARAALDLACYDLVGKSRGLRAVELIGGARVESLRVSWTVASVNPAVVEQQLAAGAALGCCDFNIKVGPPQTPEYDLWLARRVREFSPGGFLWADANTGYDLETALDIAPKLADAGVEALESPMPPMRLRDYQALKRLNAVPIFLDEGVLSPDELEDLIALDVMHGLTMKVVRCGGLWNSSRMVDMALENGLELLGSGLTDGDLSMAASLHLFAHAGITRPCALNGPQFLAETLSVSEGFPPRNCLAELPTRPGLGIEMSKRAEQALTEVIAE